MTDESSAEPWLIRFMNTVFGRLGRFVGDYALAVFIVATVATAVASTALLFTETEDDVRTGYTPNGARSHAEMDVYKEFFRNQGEPLVVYVLVLAKDGGNMLRLDHMNATVQLLRYISENFTVDVGDQSFSFQAFCNSFCHINEPVNQFYSGLVVQEARIKSGEAPNERIHLGYPTMTVLGRDLQMGPYFFGVEQWSNGDDMPTNKRSSDLKYLKFIVLQFRAAQPDEVTKALLQQWERDLALYLKRHFNSDLLRPLILSDAEISLAIVQTGLITLPYLGLGFFVMTLFAVSTVCANAAYMQQLTVEKPLLAVAACISPLLACAFTLGGCFWLGVRFGSILCVTPFLILAIGVDDAFLMIHSWQRIGQRSTKPSCEAATDATARLGEVMADIGPAITITSLTNALAFGVGVFTPTPDIQLFCLVTAIGMAVDLLFQVTWFAAVLALLGQREICKKLTKSSAVATITTHFGAVGQKEELQKVRLRVERILTKFVQSYSKWLASKYTLITFIVALFIYWYVSVLGMARLEPKLSPEKLFLRDSDLYKINNLRERYVWPQYTVATIFISRPGNLTDPKRLARVNELVESLESMSMSLGKNSTQLWLRDFEKFSRFTGEKSLDYDYQAPGDDGDQKTNVATTSVSSASAPWQYNSADIPAFLAWPEFQYWNAFLRFGDVQNGSSGRQELTSFFFLTAFHGDQLRDWGKRAVLLNRWRAIVDRFADIGASVYEEDAHFLDQIASLVPVTAQTAMWTLVCMVIICAAFMWSVVSVTVAAFAIVSIVVGVFGGLSWWRLDLDPITMTCMCMCIGFSVDFTAHVTYHFHRSGIEQRQVAATDRLAQTLSAVGWPMLQAGLSTILTVFSLLCVHTYMSEVFVKSIVLVILLGFAHGLIVVPAVLVHLPTATRTEILLNCRQRRKNAKMAKNIADDAAVVSDNDRHYSERPRELHISTTAANNGRSLSELLVGSKVQPMTAAVPRR